jgi:hypothetical protein
MLSWRRRCHFCNAVLPRTSCFASWLCRLWNADVSGNDTLNSKKRFKLECPSCGGYNGFAEQSETGYDAHWPAFFAARSAPSIRIRRSCKRETNSGVVMGRQRRVEREGTVEGSINPSSGLIAENTANVVFCNACLANMERWRQARAALSPLAEWGLFTEEHSRLRPDVTARDSRSLEAELAAIDAAYAPCPRCMPAVEARLAQVDMAVRKWFVLQRLEASYRERLEEPLDGASRRSVRRRSWLRVLCDLTWHHAQRPVMSASQTDASESVFQMTNVTPGYAESSPDRSYRRSRLAALFFGVAALVWARWHWYTSDLTAVNLSSSALYWFSLTSSKSWEWRRMEYIPLAYHRWNVLLAQVTTHFPITGLWNWTLILMLLWILSAIIGHLARRFMQRRERRSFGDGANQSDGFAETGLAKALARKLHLPPSTAHPNIWQVGQDSSGAHSGSKNRPCTAHARLSRRFGHGQRSHLWSSGLTPHHDVAPHGKLWRRLQVWRPRLFYGAPFSEWDGSDVLRVSFILFRLTEVWLSLVLSQIPWWPVASALIYLLLLTCSLLRWMKSTHVDHPNSNQESVSHRGSLPALLVGASATQLGPSTEHVSAAAISPADVYHAPRPYTAMEERVFPNPKMSGGASSPADTQSCPVGWGLKLPFRSRPQPLKLAVLTLHGLLYMFALERLFRGLVAKPWFCPWHACSNQLWALFRKFLRPDIITLVFLLALMRRPQGHLSPSAAPRSSI